MPKLTMLSAPSAAGKSTLAREMMLKDPNAIRLNRDDLRTMSITKWKPSRETWIIAAELGLAAVAAKIRRNIIVDDTNLMPGDEARWKECARQIGYEFIKVKLSVPLEECIKRDNLRVGNARIGRPAIERQFLRAGLWDIPPGKQTVIFDIDGTMADLEHRVKWLDVGGPCPTACKGTDPTCKYCNGTGKLLKKSHDNFYNQVQYDKPIEAVCNWIRACKESYHILIVSGRSPEKCGKETVRWLSNHYIPYDHLIMRRPNMHGPDDEEKQLILDDILKLIPKENIAFVVDDRPSVVKMWKANGLRVFPVRGRDDDKFYAKMDEIEATWPRPDLAPEVVGGKRTSADITHLVTKSKYKRPLSSYVAQAIKRVMRWRRK